MEFAKERLRKQTAQVLRLKIACGKHMVSKAGAEKNNIQYECRN